jgi:hypothetical protein
MAGCMFVYLHDALVEYSLSGPATSISKASSCEPSLLFFEKYNDLMSKGHVSSFIFNVLIYKSMSISLRLAIFERLILREIEVPREGWILSVIRLLVGRRGVNFMKQLRRILQARDYST